MADKFRQTRDMARAMLRGSIVEDATAQYLAQVIEHIHADRIAPTQEYLRETAARLHQLAGDGVSLAPRDLRRLANDMQARAEGR